MELASAFACKVKARSAFLPLETGANGATGETKVVSKTVARTSLPTDAGDQDDVSLEHTPQITNDMQSYIIHYMCIYICIYMYMCDNILKREREIERDTDTQRERETETHMLHMRNF